ncbi:MAG TPA: holo-ACP synthase [Candidatus Nanoarchaeia archaeon]|nr:holo-ACP synthase [Candidatus Nanoarchaeia archaeon]
MIIGTGVDIERIKRFHGMDRKKDKTFFNRIYTSAELNYCFSKKNPAQHLAVRFAAKEAVIKALHHVANFKPVDFSKIEVEQSSTGAPFIQVQNKKELRQIMIHLSMSHCDEYAMAFVIVETK